MILKGWEICKITILLQEAVISIKAIFTVTPPVLMVSTHRKSCGKYTVRMVIHFWPSVIIWYSIIIRS